jgi:hypothetical protein
MNKIANRKFSLATFVKQPSFHDETISDLDGPRYEKWAWKKPMMKSDYKRILRNYLNYVRKIPTQFGYPNAKTHFKVLIIQN